MTFTQYLIVLFGIHRQHWKHNTCDFVCTCVGIHFMIKQHLMESVNRDQWHFYHKVNICTPLLFELVVKCLASSMVLSSFCPQVNPRLYFLNTHTNTDLVSISHCCQIVRSMHAWLWHSMCMCVGACTRVRVLDTLTQGKIHSTKNSHISFVF